MRLQATGSALPPTPGEGTLFLGAARKTTRLRKPGTSKHPILQVSWPITRAGSTSPLHSPTSLVYPAAQQSKNFIFVVAA